jgi:hypothetical protein
LRPLRATTEGRPQVDGHSCDGGRVGPERNAPSPVPRGTSSES